MSKKTPKGPVNIEHVCAAHLVEIQWKKKMERLEVLQRGITPIKIKIVK